MTTTTPLAIGIDLGATKIAAALVTRQGQMIATARRPTAVTAGTAVVLDNLAALVNELLDQATGTVAGVGIGTPGHVDPVAGVVRNAVNLGWTKVNLVAEIQSRLETALPIFVEKDANAEVLGEIYFGAGQGYSDVVYLGLGSGLGGGLIVNGQLVSGHNLAAAEIGHLSLDPVGRPCNCGRRGCAETIVSGNGVLAVIRDYLAEGNYATCLTDTPDLSPATVVTAAETGDPLAQAVLTQTGQWLGQIVSMIAMILNPACIIIGGGFGRAAFKVLLPAIQTELRQRALPVVYERLMIAPSQLKSSAIGASCLVWQQHPPAAQPDKPFERG